MKVSIVVPFYIDGEHRTRLSNMTVVCLDNLFNPMFTNYDGGIEVIAVDDGSPKENFSRVYNKRYSAYPNFKLVRKLENSGFAKAVNAGIKEATGDLILLLNNDTIPLNDSWLAKLVSNLIDKKLDMTAPSGGRFDKDWNYIPGEITKNNQNFTYLTGWSLLVRKEVFNKIGLIPENFKVGFFEDTLFSHRAKKAGLKLGITEDVALEHYFHTTFKLTNKNVNELYNHNRKIFLDIIRKEG